MCDARTVRRRQCGGNLRRDRCDVAEQQRTARDARLQRLARTVGHDDERDASVVEDFMDLGDVGMFQRAGRARLAKEAAGCVRIARGVQRLERDRASELKILGEIHDAHAAGAELPQQPEMSDRVAGSRRHSGGSMLQYSIWNSVRSSRSGFLTD